MQVPSISTEELVLLRHTRCVLSHIRCNGHSLLLSSYLSRIGRIENLLCSACGHPSQDTFHLILHCPTTGSFRRSLFGDSLSLCDLWSRPWSFWGSMVNRHVVIPRKGSGNNNKGTTLDINRSSIYLLLLNILKSSQLPQRSFFATGF